MSSDKVFEAVAVDLFSGLGAKRMQYSFNAATTFNDDLGCAIKFDR